MSRSRLFDEDVLLDAAIELFWTQGYRAGSLTELSAATGVGNGSLYQAYGSKRMLFVAAFRRYCARRASVVAAVFDDHRSGVENILNAYFEAIIADCLSHPDRRGCLMLNTASELGDDEEIMEISIRTVDAMETAVADALSAAAPPGLDIDEIALTAAQVVALSQAMIQLSRMGREPAELRRIARHAAASAQQSLLAA